MKYRPDSGKGAALYGGRWNSVGIEVVYTSSHISLAILEILVRQAHASPELLHASRTGQALIDACATVRGLLTDEEVDTLFRRTPSFSRPVDLE